MRTGAPAVNGMSDFGQVSTFQLFVDFIMFGCGPGPRHHGRTWVCDDSGLRPLARPMLRRSRSFATCLKTYLSDNGFTAPSRYNRLCGNSLVVRLLCYRLTWPDDDIVEIDASVFRNRGSQVHNTKQLDRCYGLPVVAAWSAD